ncbi:hypothetical protein OG735_05230 [Streptomyces sp. NBC_01210]|uniref:hypothetical protein n=1 Tax=Streptomyces sp. NBC_01210 TaxID=2903774 RepID=UPI002E15D6E8|nr:hypothetical protein OG735_05230 [Streptomyces sp. NBC_01210]
MPSPIRPGDLGSAKLMLGQRGRMRTVALHPEPQSDGTLLLTATTPLRHHRHDGPAEAGPRLLDGVWRLAVEATDTAGRVTRFALAAPSVRAMGGPTLLSSPSVASGTTFRIVRSVDQHAMLKVTPPRQQAELSGFELRWDRITAHGRLIAATSTWSTAPAPTAGQHGPGAGGAVLTAMVVRFVRRR